MPNRQIPDAGRKTALIARPSLGRTLALGILVAAFACRGRDGDRKSEALAWEGVEVALQREIPHPEPAWLKEEGFPRFEELPAQRFVSVRVGLDSAEIRLLEFRHDFEAYAVFQRIADPDELVEGFSDRDGRVFFRAGRWLGTSTQLGREDLRSKLDLPHGGWGTPELFASMIHQGRISHSERVLFEFLGTNPPVPVFSVQLDCHGDSAWIYASPGMPDLFASEIAHRPGYSMDSASGVAVGGDSGAMDPIRLEFFEHGMVGIEGCFDSALTTRWLSSQRLALKGLENR